jgi:hypothetical protein
MVGAVPKLGVEMPEKAARGWLPGPPEIEDHFPERLEGGRQHRDHIKRVVGRHGAADMERSVNLAAKILASSIP